MTRARGPLLAAVLASMLPAVEAPRRGARRARYREARPRAPRNRTRENERRRRQLEAGRLRATSSRTGAETVAHAPAGGNRSGKGIHHSGG